MARERSWLVSEDDVDSIMYVQTHGVDEPSKSATPFFLAAAAAAMDIEAAIYFTMDGATLLKKGVAEELMIRRGEGGQSLRFFMEQALELGVKFYVCQPSLDLHDLSMEDLIDGVEMIGGAAFNSMALDADVVISF
jgi:predicted peroxiredoxin